jgi:orotate phosphoribosyltransferase
VSTKERLLRLLKEKALRFGDFVLASGRSSSYYVNGKLVSLDPEGLYLLSEVILDTIKDDQVDAIGGMTLGADPMVGGVVALAGQRGVPLRGFIVRKERKDHGTASQVEGALKSGDRVVIVEDVSTTGGSSLKAIKVVEELGCEIVKVIVLLDRDEGARENFGRGGYRFEPIFTLRDLGIEVKGTVK